MASATIPVTVTVAGLASVARLTEAVALLLDAGTFFRDHIELDGADGNELRTALEEAAAALGCSG